MAPEHKKSSLVFFLLFLVLFLWSRLTFVNNENAELLEKIDSYEEILDDYKDALDQANSNIDEAKWSAWESYEDMGDALDFLETVDIPQY